MHQKIVTNSSLFFFFMVMKGAGDAVRQHWGQDRELKSLMFCGVGREGSFKLEDRHWTGENAHSGSLES